MKVYTKYVKEPTSKKIMAIFYTVPEMIEFDEETDTSIFVTRPFSGMLDDIVRHGGNSRVAFIESGSGASMEDVKEDVACILREIRKVCGTPLPYYQQINDHVKFKAKFKKQFDSKLTILIECEGMYPFIDKLNNAHDILNEEIKVISNVKHVLNSNKLKIVDAYDEIEAYNVVCMIINEIQDKLASEKLESEDDDENDTSMIQV